MRKTAIAAMLLATLIIGSGRADAATLQVTLSLDGNTEIDIPITIPPGIGEFQALDGLWGRVTYNGALVAHYVYARDNKTHALMPSPNPYPNQWFTFAIRTVGAPSDLLMFQGTARPPADGGGIYGGVTVATGALAFLREATFTVISSGNGSDLILTFTY